MGQSFTSMQFPNATGSPVIAWLTLGANSAGTVANVTLVDVSTGPLGPAMQSYCKDGTASSEEAMSST